MSQNHQATDIQWSYIERNGLNFTQSETNWQFKCIMNNSISSSVEKLEWDRSNTKSSELLSGNEGSVDETVCGTRGHQGGNGNGRN